MEHQKHDEDIQKHGDLEIEEDIKSQERIWKAQRIGRILFAIILLAGIAGVFGNGPLSNHQVSKNGLTVQYERIAYRDTDQTMSIRFPLSWAQNGKARIWIDQDSLSRLRLSRIRPEPDNNRLAGSRILFEYNVSEKSKDGLVEIALDFRSESFGSRLVEVGVENGPAVKLTQFYWP